MFMKPIYIVFLLLALMVPIGCATQSGDGQGGPIITDLDREFFTQQAVIRALKNSSEGKAEHRAELFLKLANAMDVVTDGEGAGATGLALEVALNAVTDGKDIAPEDKAVIEYLSKRVLAEFQVDMVLPLNEAQRRILGIYSQAIQDAVLQWEASVK